MNVDSLIVSCITDLFFVIYVLWNIKRKYNNTTTNIILLLELLLLLGFETIKYQVRDENNFVFYSVWLIQMIVAQIIPVILSKESFFIAFSTSLNAAAITLNGIVFSNIIMALYHSVLLKIPTCIVVDLIEILLIHFYFVKKAQYLHYYSKKSEILLCIIPLLYYVTAFLLMIYPVSIRDYPYIIPGLVSMSIMTFVAYYIVIKYLYAQAIMLNAEYESKMYKFTINELKDKVGRIEKNELDSRIINHDRRHYIFLLQQLLKEEKYVEAQNILDSVSNKIDSVSSAGFYKNIVINAILKGFYEQAKAGDIEFTVSGHLPEKLPFDECKFGVVISNLCENAINECNKLDKTSKKIMFNSTSDNNILFIEIANSCRENVKFDENDEYPVTDNPNHGFGMKSIQQFAKKHNIQFSCSVENSVFFARLLINLEAEKCV